MTQRIILVVAPHGLDEVLGCGGTMARHASSGDMVHTLFLFGDGTGRDARRRHAAVSAGEILGVAPPEFAGFPENRSDTIPLVELIAVVEERIRRIAPDTVLVSHGSNLNIDHRNAFQASVTAARPAPGMPVRTILAYEIRSSTDWAPPTPGFAPNLFVDVSETVDRKMRALEAYGDEMCAPPHSRSAEAVRAHLTARGASVGLVAAEAFEMVRCVLDRR